MVFINFEKGKGTVLSSIRGDLGGQTIDLFVDLGDLEPFSLNGEVGAVVASLCSSDRRRGKKYFFSFKIP